MGKNIFTISSNTEIATRTFRLVLSSPQAVPAAPGQFANIAIDGFFLRRPISVCNCETDGNGTRLTLIYKVVGDGTAALAKADAGSEIELLTPLGHGFDPEACREAALLVGGGLGTAPLYLLARELLARGKKLTLVSGFNRADEAVLREEFAALGVEMHIATLDGSLGTKGFVTDVIASLRPEYDYFYSCGPMPMMKALGAVLERDGEFSLEERMGCGAGYCYCCTCHTASGAKRVCKDGPVFKKAEVIW